MARIKKAGARKEPGAAAPKITPPAARPPAERRFGALLLTICLLALAARGLMLVDYLRTNPLARAPLWDATEYWEWAGEIARGKLVGDIPFFSAPLYPYALGLLRAAGGGLAAVYAAQALADIMTACLLAWAARTRFGPAAGLTAGALFLLLRDPASMALRVLASTLHLLLVALLYFQLVRWPDPLTVRRCIAIGITLGLLSLAYPPAIVLTVPIGLWLFGRSARSWGDALRAAVPTVAAMLLVLPATLHNWLACREFILISAQGGITFAQGNAPGAIGIYEPLPGVSLRRKQQNQDALRVYMQETGRPASWSATSSHFFRKGLEYWRSDPLDAFQLAVRKVYLFLSAKNYSDTYTPNAEVAYGLNQFLRLAPLQVPWLVGPALVGLFLLLRQPVRYAPEWLLLALPLAVCVAFWYSPRYRIPAVPIIVVLSAFALVKAWQWREHLARAAVTLAAMAGGLLLGPLNGAIGCDRNDPAGVPTQLSAAHVQLGNLAAAVHPQREVVRLRPGDVKARLALGDMLRDLGAESDALAVYEQAYAMAPDNERLAGRLGRMLLAHRRFAEAESVLSRAVSLHPSNASLVAALVRTKEALGRPEEAADVYKRYLELKPDNTDIRIARGALLNRLGRYDEAYLELNRAVQKTPDSFEAHYNLGITILNMGNPDAAEPSLQRALDLRPRSSEALYALGYLRQAQGLFSEAGAYFREALTLDPNNTMYQMALEYLQHAEQAAQLKMRP